MKRETEDMGRGESGKRNSVKVLSSLNIPWMLFQRTNFGVKITVYFWWREIPHLTAIKRYICLCLLYALLFSS